jgi:hypothetical protein
MLMALALLLGGASQAGAGLITNGSFENPAIAPNSFAQFSSIPGWTATRDVIEIQSNFLLGGGTPAGNQYAELDANNPDTIVSDPFPTVPGDSYRVSYLYSARPGGAPVQSLSLQFGTLPPVFDSRVNTGSVNFTPSSFVFVANATSTQLTFSSLDAAGSSVGNLIDDVTVIPEPASLALFGMILLPGAAYWGWRWRKQGAIRPGMAA